MTDDPDMERNVRRTVAIAAMHRHAPHPSHRRCR